MQNSGRCNLDPYTSMLINQLCVFPQTRQKAAKSLGWSLSLFDLILQELYYKNMIWHSFGEGDDLLLFVPHSTYFESFF